MKIPMTTAASLAFLLAACSQAPDATATKPKDSADMTMSDGQSPPTAAAVPATETMAQDVKTATATGTVNSIDAVAGKITLAHGPVQALGWPGMTMSFNATQAQIARVKVGQRVRFEFQARGMEATLTQIDPEK